MRRITVVSVGRSDYSLYRPVLRSIEADPDLELRLVVSGSHLAAGQGLTAGVIEADGFTIDDRVDLSQTSDTPRAIAEAMSVACAGFAEAYERSRPDILLVLGDRFEMHAAVVAATPFNVPVAHIHGGELTLGAMDDAFRHSISKLSHLHFVSHPEYARRVRQMGEEPWRVILTGAPSLDNLVTLPLLPSADVERWLGIPLDKGPLLVTYHPVTREYDQAEFQVHELLAAVEQLGCQIIFTAPNADTNGRVIRNAVQDFVGCTPNAHFVESLGPELYFTLMSQAAVMVGNSSSGLIEAPSFCLPVVNVGTRQEGRVRAQNVIDVGYRREEILEGIRGALSPEFRSRIAGMVNPFGDGRASERIVAKLRDVALGDRLLRKRFVDWIDPEGEHSGHA